MRARKSTSALKYIVSITTFWDADMIDMPCTIDDHWPLRNMPAVEAPINAKSRAEAPIDTESRTEALPSRKVDLRLDLRLFHFSFGHADFFVCSFMDGHPQATVVLFPCSHSQGFKEATMGITLFHLHLFLALQCIARGGVLHIQVSAGDESRMAGDGGVLCGWRQRCLVWPEMTVDSDTGWWHSAVLAVSYILALWPS